MFFVDGTLFFMNPDLYTDVTAGLAASREYIIGKYQNSPDICRF